MVLFELSVYFMVRFLSSYNLMPLISFVDVVRIPTTREVEARVTEARCECDVLIRHLVGLSAIEADIPFV